MINVARDEMTEINEVVEFLKDRGYHDSTLEKVKGARITRESINALTLEDFKNIGIALADARLLGEEFNRSRTELKELIESVRRKGSNKINEKQNDTFNKKRKVNLVNVEFAWNHFSEVHEKFVSQKLKYGGGLRRKKLARNSQLEEVLRVAKNIYFPSGKNKKGWIALMTADLLGSSEEALNDLNCTIGDYLEKQYLRTPKFYLQTRVIDFGDGDEDDFENWQYEKSSSSEFADTSLKEDMNPTTTSANVLQIMPSALDTEKKVLIQDNTKFTKSETGRNLALVETVSVSNTLSNREQETLLQDNLALKSTGEDTDISSKNMTSNSSRKAEAFQENLNSRRQLIKDQDMQYAHSLETDQKKKIIEEQEKSKIIQLKARQLSWKAALKREANIEDDFVTVAVNHVTKGRITRFFFSDEKVFAIYLWIGSLSPFPEYFTLSLIKPENILHPNESVETVERNIIMMNITENEPPDFFNDLLSVGSVEDSSSACASLNKASRTAVDIILNCPICSERKSAAEIEYHAANCAARKYIEIEDSDNSDTDENDAIIVEKEGTVQNIDETEITVILENKIREIYNASEKKGLSIKVRRNHEFADFCERFSKQWIRNNIGNLFVVKYFGESGIDEDSLQEMKVQLLQKNDKEGFIPRSNLYGDITGGKFLRAGELMASSICMGGPAPDFFQPWVYDYFTKGLDGLIGCKDMILSSSSKFYGFFTKLKQMKSSEDLRNLILNDEGLTVLSEIGFKGVPAKVKISDKENLLQSLVLKETLLPLLPPLDQIKEGLKLYGLLDLMKAEQQLFKIVFVENNILQWTFEKFEDFVEAVYSEHGTSQKNIEINVFKAFLDAMESFFYEATTEDASIGEIMKFVSGTSSIPPLGLPGKLKVLFKRWCANSNRSCKCKPTVSTCALSLTLPVHYNNKQAMKEALTEAAGMSQGFDK